MSGKSDNDSKIIECKRKFNIICELEIIAKSNKTKMIMIKSMKN